MPKMISALPPRRGQARPIPGRAAAMARNAAGGFAFKLDDWARFERFLILGAEGGTYYASARTLVSDNLDAVWTVLGEDGPRAVSMIVTVSTSGRAPRNDPAIVALAMATATGDDDTRQAAFEALPKVVRTGTHLFQFAEAVQRFRGWGRALRRAVARWYETRPLDQLVLQAIKYPSRQVAGPATRWTHRDLLRLAHPTVGEDADRAALLKAIVDRDAGRPFEATRRPALEQWDAARALLTKEAIEPIATAAAIRAHRLPREAVPTEALRAPEVWEALLEEMPATAMIRNLGKMTEIGLIAAGSQAADRVVARLREPKALAAARVHPIQLLLAHAVYAKGGGVRGKLVWSPVRAVAEALEQAFYASFRTAPKAGRRLMLALDVSGSMGWEQVAGTPLTPREAAAAMALVTAAREPFVALRAFTDRLVPLSFGKGARLDQAVSATERLPFGRTDCAQPMLAALEERLEVDGFVVYTDNETWAGATHPMEALDRYRQATGIAAKLIVVGMTSTGFSIADPEDAGTLDVVGFDAAAPALMTEFLRA